MGMENMCLGFWGVGSAHESCNFFMWCDDFMAAGTSCKSPCQCNEEVMQKLVQENEKLRKRLHQLELQLEKKTRIAATLGRIIGFLDVSLVARHS
ncbi:hypothetical protein Taro_045149 [Colocasia esculenta]|uniref:Uncharacterized protein n=1 Tax=Colocasia esculenta TaxID=4460 RepID=A0A843X675_COLES|nr:hypothetical protein [Colocasia esculenta]